MTKNKRRRVRDDYNTFVTIEAHRSEYSMEEAGKNSMTVGELIDYLGSFDANAPVIISNDKGYTYGSICRWDIEEQYEEFDKDEFEDLEEEK